MLHTALPEVFAGSFASSFEKERGFVTLRETGREQQLLAVTLSGGQPSSREQKSEQRLTPKEKLFLEGYIKSYFPLSTIMKHNFYLNLSAVTFINSFCVVSWLWIIQAMEREFWKFVPYKWPLYTENTDCKFTPNKDVQSLTLLLSETEKSYLDSVWSISEEAVRGPHLHYTELLGA